VNYARCAGLLNIKSSQRYCIDKVYTSTGLNEHPKISKEAVYDVIKSEKDRTLAEIEIFAVLLESLDILHEHLPSHVMRLTDSRLIDAIISICCFNISVTKETKINIFKAFSILSGNYYIIYYVISLLSS